MKGLLWFGGLVLVIVLSLFGPLKPVYEEAKAYTVSMFGNVLKVPETSRLMSLREGFFHNNLSLQVHQTDYVIQITSTTEELRKFYQLYCVNDDKNPFIYGANLRKLCSHITDSGLHIQE